MAFTPPPPSRDRERILLEVIRRLQTGSYVTGHGAVFVPPWKEEAVVGDVVLVTFIDNHAPFGFGTLVEVGEGHIGKRYLVRDLASEHACWFENCEVVKVHGLDLSRPVFLYGAQRVFHEKVLKAFHRGDEMNYRPAGVEFPEQGVAVIGIRPHIFSHHGHDDEVLVPMECRMRFTNKTSIKAILQAMRNAGYGTAEHQWRSKDDTSNTAPSATEG